MLGEEENYYQEEAAQITNPLAPMLDVEKQEEYEESKITPKVTETFSSPEISTEPPKNKQLSPLTVWLLLFLSLLVVVALAIFFVKKRQNKDFK